LQRKAGAGQELKTEFDVKRRMFREFFKINELSRKRMDRVHRLVIEYSHLLFHKNDLKNRELLVAYMLKTFEKMLYNMGNAAHETPPPFVFAVTNRVNVRVAVDCIFFKREKAKVKGKTQYFNKTVFCYLIPHESWTLEDLSNRFENYITAKHLWPAIRDGSGKYEIMYYCPDTGKEYTIEGAKLSKCKWSIDKARLVNACERIEQKQFMRQPIGVKCKICPVKDTCEPHDFSNGGTSVSYVLPPLDL